MTADATRVPSKDGAGTPTSAQAPEVQPAAVTDLQHVHLLLAVMFDFAMSAEGKARSDAQTQAHAGGESYDVLSFLDHVGFDLRTLRTGRDLYPARVAHWRVWPGVYDVARLKADLVSWPPVAAAIAWQRQQTKAEAREDEPQIARPLR